MLRPIDDFYIQQPEPNKSCFQYLRQHKLGYNENVTEKLSYGMPFFYYKGKRFAYLWVHKKNNQPYIGIVNGNLVSIPGLHAEKRTRMKILFIDPLNDIPIMKINQLLKEVFKLYS